MRARALAIAALLLVLGLVAYPPAALGTGLPADTVQQAPGIVTMRLGISAGDAIQQTPRGADRRALEGIIPELFQTATTLGVRIDTVSVGRGFWSEDGEVESENDLDLVVTGLRENVLALGATLGQRWNQSVVLAWEIRSDGEMLTATIPLPNGTTGLNEATFGALAKALTDGGHIRYAGAESLVFVAHTGDDGEDDFRTRMALARTVLETADVRPGTPIYGRAMMETLDKDSYQQYVDGAVRGKAMPASVEQPPLRTGPPIQATPTMTPALRR
jgi:hypothetical protein